MTKRPFQDLLIVDVSGTVATTYAGKLFVDYGARVVNVEPLDGFVTRSLDPLLANGASAMHGYLNANKESVCTDNPVLHPCVAAADLILLDPVSVDVEDVENNVCAISWFGMNGPYAEFEGSDAAIQALTGLMIGIGDPEGPPVIPKGFHPQMIGGVSAFNGALAFLMGRHKNDEQHASRFVLDASIFEANMCFTDLGPINAYNKNPLPFRMGINKFPPTYPLGIWPCKDGWLGVTCLTPEQWRAFCKLLELDDFADVPLFQRSSARLEAADILEPAILEALLKHSAEDLFYRGQAMRIPLARVPTMDELFSVDQYRERQAFNEYTFGDESFIGPSVPYRLHETSPELGGHASELGVDNDKWQNAAVNQSAEFSKLKVDPLPLDGVTIVDLGMGWAAPLATRSLADLGATVIKVESCTRFDWWRSWEATADWIADDGAEKSLQYVYVNRNKRDVTLDLESPRGRELLLKLVAQADALIENFSGEVMAKLNLDYEQLKKANADLVMVSMPPFGGAGPWAGFRAYGSTVEQSSGLPHLNGSGDQPPTMLHVAYGDAVSGINGTAALLTALYHKQRTGQGQYVDLSQVECLFPLAAPGILSRSVAGTAFERTTNNHADIVPQGVYPCSGDDCWILVQVLSEDGWRGLCDLVPTLKQYQPNELQGRQRQIEQIEIALREWTLGHEEKAAMRRLQQIDGVVAASLNNAAKLLDEPHLTARGYLQMLDRDFVGRQPHPSPPWRLGVEPLPIRSPAPTLGQDNQLVLGEMLGVTPNEMGVLQEEGIIGSKPRLRS